jgi:hypothetical protein
VKQQSVESQDLPLILALSVADFRWFQPAHIQHFWVFCLLQACQNMNRFQRILNHLWIVGTTLLSGLHSFSDPWKPS